MSDPIRQMIEAREWQHDFEFETRTIDTTTAQLSTDDFAGRVAVYERTMSPWLGLSEVIIGTGRDLVYPKLTADPTTYTPGQGTAITPSDPVLGDITVQTVGYKAYGKLSWETVQDAEVDISRIVATSAARSIALAFGSAATSTILSGITNGGTATGTPFVTGDDLLTLMYARPAPIRANGQLVASNTALLAARKWKDTSGGYLWQPSNDLGQPGSLFGAPVYEDPYLGAIGSATTSWVFGDVNAALVVKMAPVRVSLSQDFAFDEDVISWKCVHRIGIGVKDATALAKLVNGNT